MNPRYTEVKWKTGSVFKADPDLALYEIEQLDEANGGKAPDGALVEHAKNPKSVLHNEFEWDDSIAGYKYRLETERKIKRSFVVVREDITAQNDNPFEIRVFQRATIQSENDAPRRIWWNTFDMLKDPCGREQLLGNARKELNQFRNKYQALTELSDILNPIEEFLKS